MSRPRTGLIRRGCCLALALFVQFSLSCSNLRSYPLPVVNGDRASAEQLAAFTAAQTLRGFAVKSFRGLYRCQIAQGAQRLTTKQAVVFEKPDRIRVETFPLNGGLSLGLLIGQEGKLSFIDPIQKTKMESESDQNLIYRALRLRLNRQDLMSYLSGNVPEQALHEQDGVLHLALSNGDAAFADPDFRWYYLLAGESKDLIRAELRSPLNQGLELRIDYLNYTKISGISVPDQIEIVIPRDSVQIELNLISAKINEEIKSELFN